MIFVSTSGFPELTGAQTAELLAGWGFCSVELSGGLYAPRLYQDLLGLSGRMTLQLHNYFPPPEHPFVFNLASLDQTVAAASLEHAKRSLRWAVEFSRPVYSFHAGYLLDPQPTELGRTIAHKPLYDRVESLKRFIDRVNLLADCASSEGAQLLVENNVLSRANYDQFGVDPLLMTTPQETAQVMEQTPENVNLLVDVGHLKVSGNVLAFDPAEMLSFCAPWIRAYHLSDNDGLHDSNQPVSVDSWFWPHLKVGLDYYSIEVNTRSAALLKEQQLMISMRINNKEGCHG